MRGDLCVFLSPSGPRRYTNEGYTDEGESGSGADGGESVLCNGGRDGGESGMLCLRKDWWCATLYLATRFNRP